MKKDKKVKKGWEGVRVRYVEVLDGVGEQIVGVKVGILSS